MEYDLEGACCVVAKRYLLSNAELCIIGLIAKGLTPSEIAQQRSRSIATIRTQIKHIMCKMDIDRVHGVLVEVFQTAAHLRYQQHTPRV